MNKFIIPAVIFAMLFILAPVPSAFAEEGLISFCTSCHGTGGAGPGETIPYIGGQTKEYLSVSMNEIKEKKRYSTMMWIITQGYDANETERMSELFSTREWKNSANNIDAALAAKGVHVAESCTGCHGALGKGAAETPRISGQPAKYLFYSMLEYKKQLRNNGGNAPLMDMVIEMDEQDLRAVSEHFSGLK